MQVNEYKNNPLGNIWPQNSANCPKKFSTFVTAADQLFQLNGT